MIFSYFTLTFIIAAFTMVVLVYFRQKAYYKTLNKFPGTPPTFLIGSLSWILDIYAKAKTPKYNASEAFAKRLLEEAALYQEIGMHCSWKGPRPIVSIYKAEIAKLVLSSSISNKKSYLYKFLQIYVGTGLFTSEGEKWKQRRMLLNPCLHIRLLDGFFPVFNRQSLVLVEKLKSHSDREYVDIAPLCNLCALDIVCETMMGVSVGAQTENFSDYIKALRNAISIIEKRKFRPWLWSDFSFGFTNMGKMLEKDIALLHNFTDKIIKEKKEQLLSVGHSSENDDESEGGYRGKPRKNLLDLLLHMNLNGEHLSEADIREEVDTFTVAGHDTMGSGIIFALYCIGLHPVVQKNISDELDGIFEGDIDRPVTLEDTRKMKYLECVLKESMRLFPPVPSIGRILGEDIEFEGLKIPNGTTVLLNILAMHRNPKVFPNPEIFNPERFLPQNSAGRHPYSFHLLLDREIASDKNLQCWK